MSVGLGSIRKRLDEVDRRIVEALADRIGLVREVAQLKARDVQRLRDLLREEDLLTKLASHAQSVGLDNYLLTRVFREILEHSLRLQHDYITAVRNQTAPGDKPLRIAYQGTEGAYSHNAATRHFATRAGEVTYHGHETLSLVLDAVRSGAADVGVLPIENTTAGSINESYDLLAKMDLSLVGEEVQSIDYCLLATENVALAEVRRVCSHPQALSLCSGFLSTLHQTHIEAFPDSAMAAKYIREHGDRTTVAIGSEEAARIYGLQILKRGLSNQKENYTRYVMVAREPVTYDPRIPCKTSLLFGTGHEHGSLLACLDVFAAHRLSLAKLESRPRPNVPWEYLFYVDFEGNVGDENVQAAIRALSTKTNFLRVFGSYPARTVREARPAEPRPAGLEAVPVASDVTPVSTSHRSRATTFEISNVQMGGTRPVILAGSSNLVNRESVDRLARLVKDMGGDLLWARCAKQSRGLGGLEVDFDVLACVEECAKAVRLPTAVEVFHEAEVDRVAARVDVLRVGAANFLNLQLLAAVGRTDRPVILGRSPLSSIEEWLQAADYVVSQGNQRVVLCESGVRTVETTHRTALDIALLPTLRERSHLPVIVDASEAAATSRFVPPLIEAAFAAGAQGAVVEVAAEEAESQGAIGLDSAAFHDLMERVRSAPSIPSHS